MFCFVCPKSNQIGFTTGCWQRETGSPPRQSRTGQDGPEKPRIRPPPGTAQPMDSSEDACLSGGAGGDRIRHRCSKSCRYVAPVRVSASCAAGGHALRYRSEEHTSALQSLMRISYAVFCLKKTTTSVYNKQTRHNTTTH